MLLVEPLLLCQSDQDVHTLFREINCFLYTLYYVEESTLTEKITPFTFYAIKEDITTVLSTERHHHSDYCHPAVC